VSLIEGRPNRRFVRAVLDDLDLMLAAFIRAQLSLCGLSLVAYTLVLGFAHFPFSFAIAAIAAIFEFIPLLGPLASGIMIMSIAVVTGYQHWLAILVFLVVWRGLQDYVNSPWLMGRGLELHPFAIILGVLISGEIAGVAGVFLSVPVMAGLRIIWKHWKAHSNAITRNRREPDAQLAG
jgi:predicted PurR-regulated permease PerM